MGIVLPYLPLLDVHQFRPLILKVMTVMTGSYLPSILRVMAKPGGGQRSAKDWTDRLDKAMCKVQTGTVEAARLACYLRQVEDYALFHLDDETCLFPTGWQPAAHPFQCGCVSLTSPPSTSENR